MKKSLLASAVFAAIGTMFARAATTLDIAFGFRMGAGFPGDVNRTHPFSVMPGLVNSSVQAPRLYGDPVLVDTATNSYRGIVVGDQSATPTTIDGIAARPYPVQQTTGGMASAFGTAAVITNQPLDVLDGGLIMVRIPPGQTPTKKGAVWVWCAASSGAHIQGGFESVVSAGNTLPITNALFNGPPDAAGIVELRIGTIL